jgi:HAD-superfamily hydrolase, subfamily IIB
MSDNMEQVDLWRKAGNIFVFATGRSISLMKRFTQKNLAYDYLITLNGGIISNAIDEILFEKVIPHAIALEIMSLIKLQGIRSYSISDGLIGYRKIALGDHSANQSTGFFRQIMLMLKFASTFSKHNVSYHTALNRPIAQITITTKTYEKAANFAALINERFYGEVSAYVNGTSVDMSYYGLSKATGIDFIGKMLNIDDSDIYCMGDSYNDLPMLEAYHGFTLPTAPDAVKEKAKDTFHTVGDAIKALL